MVREGADILQKGLAAFSRKGAKLCLLHVSKQNASPSAEEMFASGAAADELRAGRLLSLRDHFPAETFPAMKIRLRDSAHAVQRQLSAVLTCCIPSKQPCAERTTNRQLLCWLRFAKKWHLDETLQEYMQQFISGKESMTALIWHSPDLKVMFAKHVARLKSGHVLTHSVSSR